MSKRTFTGRGQRLVFMPKAIFLLHLLAGMWPLAEAAPPAFVEELEQRIINHTQRLAASFRRLLVH